MRALEICIGADQADHAYNDVAAARQGGASRIELCTQMAQDGLTPDQGIIGAARKAWGEGAGLLVMIRPRAGDFVYSQGEKSQMADSIRMAADCGADGVVLGLLSQQGEVDIPALTELVGLAQSLSLEVTFHRAFDAIAEPRSALDILLSLGIERLLSAGTPWQSGQGAQFGLANLRRWLALAGDDLELVVGGGVGPHNLPAITTGLNGTSGHYSLHSHSAVLTQGRVDADKVAHLAGLCRRASGTAC